MAQDYKCPHCHRLIGVITDAGLLVNDMKLAILSVVKLRCLHCHRLLTYRPCPDPTNRIARKN